MKINEFSRRILSQEDYSHSEFSEYYTSNNLEYARIRWFLNEVPFVGMPLEFAEDFDSLPDLTSSQILTEKVDLLVRYREQTIIEVIKSKLGIDVSAVSVHLQVLNSFITNIKQVESGILRLDSHYAIVENGIIKAMHVDFWGNENSFLSSLQEKYVLPSPELVVIDEMEQITEINFTDLSQTSICSIAVENSHFSTKYYLLINFLRSRFIILFSTWLGPSLILGLMFFFQAIESEKVAKNVNQNTDQIKSLVVRLNKLKKKEEQNLLLLSRKNHLLNQLADIESSIKKGIWINSLIVKEGVWELKGGFDSGEVLTKFVEDLEDSHSFNDIILDNIKFGKSSKKTFRLRLIN